MSTSNKTAQPEIVPGKVLVKHYRLHPNSSDVDSSSVRHQYYDPEVYDEYIREDEESGKVNNFVRMGLKTEVLYNPKRDENGYAADVPKPVKKADDAKPAEPKAKAAPKPKAEPKGKAKAADVSQTEQA